MRTRLSLRSTSVMASLLVRDIVGVVEVFVEQCCRRILEAGNKTEGGGVRVAGLFHDDLRTSHVQLSRRR